MVNTEQKMQDYLKEVLIWSSQEDNEIKTIDTFESAGILTQNEGLVIKMKTGEVFQLTIKQSR